LTPDARGVKSLRTMQKRVPTRSTAGMLVLAASLAGCSPPPAPFVDASDGAGLGAPVPCYDAALADFDGDGLVDVYTGDHWAGAMLLRNLGNGRFENVVAGSGVDPGGDQHGHGWGDADGDGRPDLYVAIGADHGRALKANRLYRNLGGRFDDVATAANAQDPSGRGRGVTWVDYDRDGRLDVLVTNYRTPNALLRNRGDGRFEDHTAAAGLPAVGTSRAVWTDYDGDGWPDVLLLAGKGGLRLLRNRGDATFVDVTRAAGLPRRPPAVGAAFGDADGDGDLDLALTTGTEYPRAVALAAGTAAFTQIGRRAGVDLAASTPPTLTLVSWDAPVALDDAHLLVRDLGGGRWQIRWSGEHALSGRVGPAVTAATLVGAEPWRPRRTLRFYQNRGDGTFVARDVFARRPPRANGAGVAWGDLDDDGDLDLYVVQNGVEGADEPDAVFLNDGGGGLTLAAALPPAEARGSGVHLVDLDGDGRLDAFLTNGWGTSLSRGRHRLLRNIAPPAHWLVLDLVGTRANRPGLGAWVDVEAGGRHMVRYHAGGALYAQDLVPVHVGLGTAARARVTVRWPSGTVDVVDTDSDRRLRVVEGAAPAPPDQRR
jgi:hypothetical protein